MQDYLDISDLYCYPTLASARWIDTKEHLDNWSFGISFIGRIKARFSYLYFIACNCMTVGFCCMISRAASDAVKFLKSGETSIVAPSLAIVRRINCSSTCCRRSTASSSTCQVVLVLGDAPAEHAINIHGRSRISMEDHTSHGYNFPWKVIATTIFSIYANFRGLGVAVIGNGCCGFHNETHRSAIRIYNKKKSKNPQRKRKRTRISTFDCTSYE